MPLTLEPLSAQHAQALDGLMSADEIAHVVHNPDLFRYRAVIADGTCVGMVGLKTFPKKDPEIVVAIQKAHREKGHATAATKAIVHETFESTNLKGVVVICEVGSPSNRVAEKAGFKFADQFGRDRAHVLTRATWEAAQEAEAEEAPAENAANNGGQDAAADEPPAYAAQGQNQAKSQVPAWLLRLPAPIRRCLAWLPLAR